MGLYFNTLLSLGVMMLGCGLASLYTILYFNSEDYLGAWWGGLGV